MFKDVQTLKIQVASHPLFKELRTQPALQIFMQYHVFAVWDFMCLLKSLQRKLTCIEIPWKPSKYSSKTVRFINEIVVAEESDITLDKSESSHFEMYLEAMDEVGANTALIKSFLKDFNLESLPPAIADFVSFNLNIARNGGDEEVASAFLYGREDLIPLMFNSIIRHFDDSFIRSYPRLIYYLERHIELDGDTHGPMAQFALEEVINNDKYRSEIVRQVALSSLSSREKLWDACLSEIERSKSLNQLTFDSFSC